MQWSTLFHLSVCIQLTNQHYSLLGSMEPQIKRGDLLFSIGSEDLRVGDVVLYKLPHREDGVPIVHRIIDIQYDREQDNKNPNSNNNDMSYSAKPKYLTKGDANNVDDRRLYRPSYEKYLPKEVIVNYE